jgi:hypothetical protein
VIDGDVALQRRPLIAVVAVADRATDDKPRSPENRSNDGLRLTMPVQVNGCLALTRAGYIREDGALSIRTFIMLTYFAVSCAVAICIGSAASRFNEWRQAVLHGPCAGQERIPLNGDD